MYVPRNVGINTNWTSLQNTISTRNVSRLAIYISWGHRQQINFCERKLTQLKIFDLFVNGIQKLAIFDSENGFFSYRLFSNLARQKPGPKHHQKKQWISCTFFNHFLGPSRYICLFF